QIGGSSIQTNLSLSSIKQSNTNISGYASIAPPLQGSNNFTGTVASGGAISFLVTGLGGEPPLFFKGQIAANGTMSGSYCSYSNGRCDNTAGGYGIWYVAPPGSLGSS
ncbi:MAG: hypothetical protein JO031_02135, partial [Ktedonobacteraceae bacterium]|nr:hypothetical protein [Ktedonobacteraceae bacterium]